MGPSLIPERSPENLSCMHTKNILRHVRGVVCGVFTKKLLKNLKEIKKPENFSCILMMMVEHYKKMWVHLKAVGKNSFQTGPSVLPKRGLEKEANLSKYSEKL